MPTFDIRVSLEGTVEVSRRLQGLADRAADLTPAWPAVDEVLHRIAAQQFASEGAQAGAPWRPLAPATQAERRRQGLGPAHPILRRTGDLLSSLTTLNRDAISVHASGYYARGTGVEYFVYHQSTKPRTRLPRRPAIAFTADQKSELLRPIRLHLTGRDPARNARTNAALDAGNVRASGGLR